MCAAYSRKEVEEFTCLRYLPSILWTVVSRVNHLSRRQMGRHRIKDRGSLGLCILNGRTKTKQKKNSLWKMIRFQLLPWPISSTKAVDSSYEHTWGLSTAVSIFRTVWAKHLTFNYWNAIRYKWDEYCIVRLVTIRCTYTSMIVINSWTKDHIMIWKTLVKKSD